VLIYNPNNNKNPPYCSNNINIVPPIPIPITELLGGGILGKLNFGVVLLSSPSFINSPVSGLNEPR